MEPLKVGEHTVEVVWVLSERAPLVPCRSASAACRDTRFHGDSGTVRLAGRFSDHAEGLGGEARRRLMQFVQGRRLVTRRADAARAANQGTPMC